MIKKISLLGFVLCLTHGLAYAEKCREVYTIGAYDHAFSKKAAVLKLGPLAAKDVPSELPKAFLEKDGSYAGGEAFNSLDSACDALVSQLDKGILSKSESWHIYKLNACWNKHTYQLRDKEYRINKTVKVAGVMSVNCGNDF